MRSSIGNTANDPLFVTTGATPATAAAQDASGAQKAPVYTPLGYQQISGPSSTGLTVPAGARRAIVQVEAQSVRWRDDGTPTASVGMLIPAGGELRYDGTLSAIRFTQVAATAVLNVAYYA
ncbi:MAG: hypothetical protein EOP02_36230 [Proteobacteria bacterium]|nr:MAG: hypothetical protein EOP02_36230 [Pseudomonadota bacterium]